MSPSVRAEFKEAVVLVLDDVLGELGLVRRQKKIGAECSYKVAGSKKKKGQALRQDVLVFIYHYIHCNYGLRFKKAEKIRKSVLEEDTDVYTVLNHLVDETGNMWNWYLYKYDSAEVLARDIAFEIQETALPFLDKYNSIEAVADGLINKSPELYAASIVPELFCETALCVCAEAYGPTDKFDNAASVVIDNAKSDGANEKEVARLWTFYKNVLKVL